MKNKWYLQAEMLIAFSALFTSLVAVIVAIYSAYIDRSYAKASVWPSMLLARSWGENRYDYLAINQGNGPAIIHYVIIKVNNQPVTQWPEAMEIVYPQEDAIFTQSHVGSGVVRPGQTITAFSTKDPKLVEKLLDVKLAVTMCYCSIYNDCWISSGVAPAQEVDACAAPISDTFLQ